MAIYAKRAFKTRIRWWLLCSVVIVWSLIWILETNFSAESHSDPMMVADELPHRYRVNLFDRRKPTVILLYSKSDSRGIGTLDHQVKIQNIVQEIIQNNDFSVLFPNEMSPRLLHCDHKPFVPSGNTRLRCNCLFAHENSKENWKASCEKKFEAELYPPSGQAFG